MSKLAAYEWQLQQSFRTKDLLLFWDNDRKLKKSQVKILVIFEACNY